MLKLIILTYLDLIIIVIFLIVIQKHWLTQIQSLHSNIIYLKVLKIYIMPNQIKYLLNLYHLSGLQKLTK